MQKDLWTQTTPFVHYPRTKNNENKLTCAEWLPDDSGGSSGQDEALGQACVSCGEL